MQLFCLILSNKFTFQTFQTLLPNSVQHVDPKNQISVQTWMSKQDDDFSRKHLFTISSIAVNDAFLCIVFCQRCSNRCTGTCISYRLCVSITNHVPFHCSMNVLKSVFVFVSFLVTVDARTLLSQNKPFRQMLHDYQHVQYFADFKIGEQDIAGIVDGCQCSSSVGLFHSLSLWMPERC